MAKQKRNNWYCLYTDGASRGNPGKAGAGIVLVSPEGKVILKKSFFLGEKTNNEAEYLALWLGLKEVCKRGIKNLYIHVDSQLVANQLKGVYKLKASHLKPIYDQIRQLLKHLSYQVYHIRREDNKLADKLANYAIDWELKQADGRS